MAQPVVTMEGIVPDNHLPGTVVAGIGGEALLQRRGQGGDLEHRPAIIVAQRPVEQRRILRLQVVRHRIRLKIRQARHGQNPPVAGSITTTAPRWIYLFAASSAILCIS